MKPLGWLNRRIRPNCASVSTLVRTRVQGFDIGCKDETIPTVVIAPVALAHVVTAKHELLGAAIPTAICAGRH